MQDSTVMDNYIAANCTFVLAIAFFLQDVGKENSLLRRKPRTAIAHYFRPFLPSIGDGSVCDSQEKS